ncbi:hypothetical protein P3X46_032053 [Hevea brasiliensis]|uniref:DNA polymerase delta subunit 3 n=1 Tax=Hevea brasiliensis TaxID=3981 RepID=A0ABQ9KP85_HEVBR|nr:hypothetical protein P3X46_032053 [Hevea brasiliensis]
MVIILMRFAFCKIVKTEIRFAYFYMIAGIVIKQDPVVTERKYINEALTLRKFILPREIHERTENKMMPEDISVKIPNNPFMIKSSTEEVAFAVDDDNFNILCSTPKISKKRKRNENEIDLHQRESIEEQASGVTEVENSDVLYVTKESQESVNSKPRKISDGKGRAKNEKSKRSNSRSTEKKQNTILNFFSRV